MKDKTEDEVEEKMEKSVINEENERMKVIIRVRPKLQEERLKDCSIFLSNDVTSFLKAFKSYIYFSVKPSRSQVEIVFLKANMKEYLKTNLLKLKFLMKSEVSSFIQFIYKFHKFLMHECEFEFLCLGLISTAIEGIHTTIFAYGQTGSGKVYLFLDFDF